MFSKLALVASLAVLAVATPAPGGGSGDSQSCSTGTIQCCNSVPDASDPTVATLLGLLGVDLGSVTGKVGLTCLPITVLAVSGKSCSTQTVCCEDNSFNGVVALGCMPINL